MESTPKNRNVNCGERKQQHFTVSVPQPRAFIHSFIGWCVVTIARDIHSVV